MDDANIELSADQILFARDAALRQLQFARDYTLQLAHTIPRTDWFTIPPGGKANLAWYLGHLTVAEYGLMLFRQRGRAEIDTELMPGWFRKKFGKGSDPAEVDAGLASPEVVEQFMTRVHEESVRTVSALGAETLWEPVDMPYAAYPRKLGAVLFAPLHEMLHAGQIGTLRRGLGLEPIR